MKPVALSSIALSSGSAGDGDLYVASVSVSGGAAGHGRVSGLARSDDGALELELRMPPELGGHGGGTNPEQLFAAGYAACFHSALKLVARKARQDSDGSTVTAEVGIGPINGGAGYGLQVELVVSLPGVERAVAEELVAKAHEVCPYSNATRGNIKVDLKVA